MRAHGGIDLEVIGTYRTGVFDEGASEIVAHDPGTQRLFVINADAVTVDVLNISDPTNPTKIAEVDASSLGNSANSVAVAKGLVAVAIERVDDVDDSKQLPGVVAFYDAETLDELNVVEVGALPDMLTFAKPGGRRPWTGGHPVHSGSQEPD